MKAKCLLFQIISWSVIMQEAEMQTEMGSKHLKLTNQFGNFASSYFSTSLAFIPNDNDVLKI